MLNLYQSNTLTVLADLFCDRHAPCHDPFLPLPVIVQSIGMGQWLKLRFAERHGIAANIECVLPAAFLWQLYRRFLPAATPFRESPFARTHMAWRMMRILKAQPDLADAISSYLNHPGDKDLRAFQLGNEISGLFDQYLMYRPDWMVKWQTSPVNTSAHYHEQWQQRLWQLLLQDVAQDASDKKDPAENLHRAALHTQLMALLGSDGFDDSALPERLTVFGLSTMPPLQLDTLTAMAHHGGQQQVDVDIFFLNPCQHYWGDIVSTRDAARRSIRALLQHPVDNPAEMTDALEDDDYLEIGNPILSSLGKQGREFFELLLDKDQINSSEHFVTPTGDTRLDFVKRDILELEYGGEFGSDCVPEPRALTDQSIQLHGCHSRQREVEILHDRILHIIRDDPGIRLNDIIVMVPDIGDYAPLVQTLFGDPLTCRIADRNHSEQSALLTTFMQLLALPFSRFTGSEVLDLLASPAISRKFSLDQKDLDLIGHWIIAAGISWETDGASKARYRDLPPDHHNTWCFGLDRLLAGFAKSEASGIWQDVLPSDITPSEADLTGVLCHVIARLNHYRREFETHRSLEAWRNLLSELMEEFFLPREDEILDINIIQSGLEQLVQAVAASRYTDDVSLDLVRHLLGKSLADQPPYAGFIAGGITFATLVPMRSIPFRVVCLLGMNDGDYPRSGQGSRSFDCMTINESDNKRRKGDRSRKLDDRYLFLEALLAAQDVFYVSYVSRGVRDNQEQPPSVIVTEWESYLKAIFTGFAVQQYPLQPFSQRHYQGGVLQSFSQTWAGALQASSKVQTTGAAKRFAPKPLAPRDSLDCTSQAQLEQFFRHSGKFFLQQRLGVYLEQDEATFRESEPFALDNLERYQLANDALDVLLRQQDLEQWQRTVLASGKIMPGEIGRQQLTGEIQRAEMIYAHLGSFLAQQPKTFSGHIKINGRQISYQTDESRGGTLLDYRVGQLGGRHLLAAWIRHLFACAAGHEATTRCIAIGGKKDSVETTTLPPVTPGDSIAQLEYLVDIYQQGITSPLLLPPATSRAWCEARMNDEKESVAMRKTVTAWVSETENDRYWVRLFDVPEDMGREFKEMATGVWGAILAKLIRRSNGL